MPPIDSSKFAPVIITWVDDACNVSTTGILYFNLLWGISYPVDNGFNFPSFVEPVVRRVISTRLPPALSILIAIAKKLDSQWTKVEFSTNAS